MNRHEQVVDVVILGAGEQGIQPPFYWRTRGCES